MNQNNLHSGMSDFDFFIGHWQVKHKKLKHRLVNNEEWEEFTGTTVTQKILGGMGNFDDNQLALPEDNYYAATIRTFNKETQLWSIWWLDGRYSDQLDAPMQGKFVDGIGTFYADEFFKGKAIKVRFLWISHQVDKPRWEQAFSQDNGKTWETNWIMEFSKAL